MTRLRTSLTTSQHSAWNIKQPVTPWHIGVAVTLQNRSSCLKRNRKFFALWPKQASVTSSNRECMDEIHQTSNKRRPDQLRKLNSSLVFGFWYLITFITCRPEFSNFLSSASALRIIEPEACQSWSTSINSFAREKYFAALAKWWDFWPAAVVDITVVIDFGSSLLTIHHAYSGSPRSALAARPFVKSLMDKLKGIGHLIDFMLDRWKSSGGSIRIAIFEDSCLGLVQR